MRRFAAAVSHCFFQPSALALLMLAGATGAAQAEPLQMAAADMQTQACRFVGRVSGDSGYGKNSGWQGLAKTSALAKAEKLGATAVVWDRMTPTGSFNGIAEAKAYRCGGTQQALAASNPAQPTTDQAASAQAPSSTVE